MMRHAVIACAGSLGAVVSFKSDSWRANQNLPPILLLDSRDATMTVALEFVRPPKFGASTKYQAFCSRLLPLIIIVSPQGTC